jgi:hypothetical protein
MVYNHFLPFTHHSVTFPSVAHFDPLIMIQTCTLVHILTTFYYLILLCHRSQNLSKIVQTSYATPIHVIFLVIFLYYWSRIYIYVKKYYYVLHFSLHENTIIDWGHIMEVVDINSNSPNVSQKCNPVSTKPRRSGIKMRKKLTISLDDNSDKNTPKKNLENSHTVYNFVKRKINTRIKGIIILETQ